MRCSFDLETIDGGVRPDDYPPPDDTPDTCPTCHHGIADEQPAECADVWHRDIVPDTRGFIMPWLGRILSTGCAYRQVDSIHSIPQWNAWVGIAAEPNGPDRMALAGRNDAACSVNIDWFETEADLITATWDTLGKFPDVATWRGDFDFGWLEFRSAVNTHSAVQRRHWFGTRYDRRSRRVDWADLLQRHGTFRDVKGAWSLPTACWALNTVWRPKGTGADIVDAVAREDWAFVIEHQARDVLATAEIDAMCAPIYLHGN